MNKGRMSNHLSHNTYSNAVLLPTRDSTNNSSPQLLSRSRSFSASETHHLKDLKIEKPKSTELISCDCLNPGTNTPIIQPKSRKRAFSDTELEELANILKDYQDFTPLIQKKDEMSQRLKRAKVIQREISKLTSEISSVKIEKDDSTA